MRSWASRSGSRASSAVRSPGASTGPARALASARSARLAAAAGVAGAGTFLLVRLAPDVRGKPLFEDEAVAGLIAARPPWEIVVTTMWDRGGAPGHFLLARFAFLFDASPDALRWLSVVFALATVAVCYDLGRRLDGRTAGVAAALVAAASGMLAVYGSFGRMYALLAFAAALAADLFIRAVDVRTTRAVALAAGAAWLLPAVHPYGGVVVAVEALVALALWRGRPLRPAVPALLAGLALVPFLVADLRLANRFEVSSEAEGRLATREEARNQLEDAIRGFGGGSGWTLAVFLVLAAAGGVILARRRPAFVAWGLVSFALPALLATLVQTGRAPDLSPRHLIFALPFWAAFVGVAVARIPFRLPALVALAAVAALSSQGIRDPREITYTAALGSREAVAEPGAWLRENVRPKDVLYPYSSVFLAGLPATGEASSLPRAQVQSLLAALDRIEYPTGDLYVAIPAGETRRSRLPAPRGLLDFGSWMLVRVDGPFGSPEGVLLAAREVLRRAPLLIVRPLPEPLADWFELNGTVICESLLERAAPCGIR